MKILVTGGAGYIGSHTVKMLVEQGHEVVVFDNLENGHRQAIPKGVKLIVGDLRKLEEVEKAFQGLKYDGVVHFAAYIEAGESVEKPGKYFGNNVLGSLYLIETMLRNETDNLVFSSTAAVYGEPHKVPIAESDPKIPINPYGESKLVTENMLEWYAGANQIKAVSLRYFNAVGAALDGTIGEDHPHKTHIMSNAVATLLGENTEFTLFGDDYPTPDGTCIRDYIHVEDLADGHLKALEYLGKQEGKSGFFDVFNLGTGEGYSNKEMLEMIERVSGKKLQIKLGPRREGDPAELRADNAKAVNILGWKPKYGLMEIVETDWRWHSTHPQGFNSSNSRY